MNFRSLQYSSFSDFELLFQGIQKLRLEHEHGDLRVSPGIALLDFRPLVI